MSLNKEALDFFRRKGRKGGKARLKKMTPEQRKAIAAKAAAARWAKPKVVSGGTEGGAEDATF